MEKEVCSGASGGASGDGGGGLGVETQAKVEVVERAQVMERERVSIYKRHINYEQ